MSRANPLSTFNLYNSSSVASSAIGTTSTGITCTRDSAAMTGIIGESTDQYSMTGFANNLRTSKSSSLGFKAPTISIRFAVVTASTLIPNPEAIRNNCCDAASVTPA